MGNEFSTQQYPQHYLQGGNANPNALPNYLHNGPFPPPSYAQGIINTGRHVIPSSNCCDCMGSYQPTGSVLVPEGYAGYSPVPMMLPANQHVVSVVQKSQVLAPALNTASLIPVTSIVVESFNPESVVTGVVPVGATAASFVNPFTNLPAPITRIIQRLGTTTPLRGSVFNRFDAVQYVPEKQAYYEGQWINGFMQGFGRLYFDNGAYFEGEFLNGLANSGHGLFIYPDGSYYLGGVNNNIASGQGEFNYRDGRLIYKGQFFNDQPDGNGIELFSDGSSYEGNFRFGKKEGQGKFVWKDGTIYTGQFENGFMQGEGVHQMSNGEVYEGEFRRNKRHGRGKHTTSLGVYTGSYKRDTKEGEGQFIWMEGKTFKGTFKDGKPDGPGSLTFPNGTTVYLIWINGVPDESSISTTNPFQQGSQLQNPRESNASIGSIPTIPGYGGVGRTSLVVNGPPIVNLRGGILAGGFVGKMSPFVGPRGSIVSVIGPGGEFRGSIIPRGSGVGSNMSIMTPPTSLASGALSIPSVMPSALITNTSMSPNLSSQVPTLFQGPISNNVLTVPQMISPIGMSSPVQVEPLTTVGPGVGPFITTGIQPLVPALVPMRPLSNSPSLPSILTTPSLVPQVPPPFVAGMGSPLINQRASRLVSAVSPLAVNRNVSAFSRRSGISVSPLRPVPNMSSLNPGIVVPGVNRTFTQNMIR